MRARVPAVVVGFVVAIWAVVAGGGANSDHAARGTRVAQEDNRASSSAGSIYIPYWQDPDPTTTTTEPPVTTTTVAPRVQAQAPIRVASNLTPGSDDWFYAIAVCETGTNPPTNGWRTGYFGIEAGYAIGNLTWDEQLTWARDIFAKYGTGAWGCKV